MAKVPANNADTEYAYYTGQKAQVNNNTKPLKKVVIGRNHSNRAIQSRKLSVGKSQGAPN